MGASPGGAVHRYILVRDGAMSRQSEGDNYAVATFALVSELPTSTELLPRLQTSPSLK